jgi:hypothetical protein
MYYFHYWREKSGGGRGGCSTPSGQLPYISQSSASILRAKPVKISLPAYASLPTFLTSRLAFSIGCDHVVFYVTQLTQGLHKPHVYS